MPPDMTGWNLQTADLGPPPAGSQPGVQSLAASRMGYTSNRLPFALDRLPDTLEREPNNTLATAQRIALPLIVNGRIDRPDDWDVFQFTGQAKQTVVAEVQAHGEELEAARADHCRLRELSCRVASDASTARNGGISIGDARVESDGQASMRSMSLLY